MIKKIARMRRRLWLLSICTASFVIFDIFIIFLSFIVLCTSLRFVQFTFIPSPATSISIFGVVIGAPFCITTWLIRIEDSVVYYLSILGHVEMFSQVFNTFTQVVSPPLFIGFGYDFEMSG